MKSSFPFVVLVLVTIAALTSSAAHAGTVTVAGVPIVLKPPPGYCALDATSGDYKRFLRMRKLLRPSVELVQVSVPCDELTAVLAGKRKTYSRWAQVQVISPGGDIRRLSISRNAFITALTKSTKRQSFDIEKLNRKMRARLKGTHLNMSASRMKIIGSDDNAAYLSMAGTARRGDMSYIVVAFGAITLVNGVPVGVYAYAKKNAPPGALPTRVAMDYLKNLLRSN